MTTDILNVPVY